MTAPRVIRRTDDDRIVREAIEFIRARSHLRAMDFTLEVGQYLFEHVYKGSVRFYRAKHVAKSTTLRRIAAGCRIKTSHNELYEAVHTHLLVQKLGRDHPRVKRPVLSSDKWKLLWKLYDDSETLLKIATWVAENRAPKALITAVVQTLEPYLAQGGQLEDLLVVPLEMPDTPYDRITRMLGIEKKWLAQATTLSPHTREEALELIDRIESRLGPAVT